MKNIRGIVIAETAKAYLMILNPTTDEWLPKSQMTNVEMGDCEQEITAMVPEWLYNKKYGIKTKVLGAGALYDDYDDPFGHDADEIFGMYFDQC